MDPLRRSALATLCIWMNACTTPKAGEAPSAPTEPPRGVPVAPAPDLAHVPPPAGVALELGAGFGDLRVANRGPATKLRSAVAVEMQRDEHWVSLPVSNLFLRPHCERAEPPECVELGPGASLEMVPWTGRLCLSQCMTPCRLDGAEEPGRYRFVVVHCEGDRAIVSAAFEGAGRPLLEGSAGH